MYKYILGLVLALTTLCANAQYAIVNFANGGWDQDYWGDQYYWTPDRGPGYHCTIWTPTWQNDHWHYGLAVTKFNGSSPWFMYDNMSDHPNGHHRQFAFMIWSYNYSQLTYNNALAAGQIPQGFGSIDCWDQQFWEWDSHVLAPPAGTANWIIYRLEYSKYNRLCGMAMIAAGVGTPPQDCTDFELAFGQ